MSATSAGKAARLLYDVASGPERLLIPGDAITFAPRFSPDGRDVVFSMADGGNTDIYVVVGRRRIAAPADRHARAPTRRQATRPTAARSCSKATAGGTQQLYVMDADGSGQRRISFGGGPLCLAELEPERRPHRLHQDRRPASASA